MKQIKQSSEKSPVQAPYLHLTVPKKKPLITPTIKRFHLVSQTYLDIAKLCIKHPIFFKIKLDDFEELLDEPEMKRVIKRNLKYFKGTKYCQFKSVPSSSTWNEACKFERYFLYPNRVLPNIDPEKTPRFLQKMAKNKLIHKALVLNFTALDCPALPKVQYTKKLNSVCMLKVSNVLFPVYERQSLGDELEGFFFLNNVGFFTNLQSLVVEFRVGKYKPETFYDIFEILSEANSSLSSLEVRMSFLEVKEEKGRNMKKIMAKFTKLKCLGLNLTFEGSLNNSGRILSTIAFLKNLKYLRVEIDSKRYFDHSDIMKFIFAQKNLETLKLNFYSLLFNDYVELFGGIQKITSLTNLCVIQREKNGYQFEYVVVFKALEALKKLQSFTLDLGYCTFYSKDFRDIFKLLLKHPSLEKANITLPMALKSDPPYCFDDEFQGGLKKLKDKLRSLKVTLTRYGNRYAELCEMISKIIMPDSIPNKKFSSSIENKL